MPVGQGNFGDAVASVEIKWFFQVRMQRSARFARGVPVGKYWKVTFLTSLRNVSRSAEVSASRRTKDGTIPKRDQCKNVLSYASM